MTKKKKKQFGGIDKMVATVSGAVCLFILAAVLNGGLGFNHVLILIAYLVLVILCLWKLKPILSFCHNHLKVIRILLIIAIIVGFLLRFSFLAIQDRFSISGTLLDTGVHWYGAQQIVDEGNLNEEIGKYERLFPYLSSYTGLVATSMSIFGKSYVAVLVLNIFFDLISTITLYFLIFFWKKKKDLALIAAAVWAINPLQIIFCGLPLAIVVVNTCIMLSIFSVFLLLNTKNDLVKMCLLSLLCGLVFAFGNAFRPIFIIFVLAVIVSKLSIVLKEKKCFWKVGISCIVLLVSYFGFGLLPGVIYEQFNPYYHGEKARAGWGVFVGANYQTKGKWSKEDSEYFFGPVLQEQSNGDIEKAQSAIMGVAIDRYKDIIARGELPQHFFNKTELIFGDVENSVYDLYYDFGIGRESEGYKILQDIILVFYLTILIVIGYNIGVAIKVKRNLLSDNLFFYLDILFVGLFLAFFFVEAMNRYSLPFIAIMVVLSIGFIDKKKQKSMI